LFVDWCFFYSETDSPTLLSSKQSLLPMPALPAGLDPSTDISKDSDPSIPSLDVEFSASSLKANQFNLSELGHLNRPEPPTANESFAFLEKPSFLEHADIAVKAESPTGESPPIQPASEVFAFLMAPRKPKQSMVSLEAPCTFVPEDPPVPPPKVDISHYLALVARSNSFVRSGPTGRIFTSDAPAAAAVGPTRSNSTLHPSTYLGMYPPSAYAVQRSRSASTSAADMLNPLPAGYRRRLRRLRPQRPPPLPRPLRLLRLHLQRFLCANRLLRPWQASSRAARARPAAACHSIEARRSSLPISSVRHPRAALLPSLLCLSRRPRGKPSTSPRPRYTSARTARRMTLSLRSPP
jgi:hypothetical protein